MTGQSSGRGKWVSPKVCHRTTSASSSGASPETNAGSPAAPGCWLTKSPAGYRSAGSYSVTHRLFVAKVARWWIEDSSAASSTGVCWGYSAYPTGWPSRLVLDGLTTCQVRPTVASLGRAASDSRVGGVSRGPKGLPYGLVSLIGSRTASTSCTVLRCPSTAMSSRAENRCWWNGAPRPGAISVAYGCSSPRKEEVNTIPVALDSSWIVPSV